LVTTAKDVTLIVVLCVLSRLPQLLSQHLMLDGDECVVGLMAKHLHDGVGVPFYFYGQSFAFSFVEVALIAASFALLGIHAVAVKLAMLLLWTLGVVFFYLTLRRIGSTHQRMPLLITLLFICSAAWATWSMKARGGYLTAFACSSLAMFLLFDRRAPQKWAPCLVGGFLLWVICESQALWFPGLVPIVVYRLWPPAPLRSWFLVVAGGLLALTGFWFLKQGLGPSSSGTMLYVDHLWNRLTMIPANMVLHLSGNYYLREALEPNLPASLSAVALTVTIFFMLGASLWLLIERAKVDALQYVFSLSVLLTLFCPVVAPIPAPRFLLPLTGVALLLLFVIADRMPIRAARYFLLISLLVLGASAVLSLRHHSFDRNREQELDQLIDCLAANEVGHAFVTDPLFQWQLAFYSREAVVTRFFAPTDRYPPYVASVYAAFEDPRRKTAIVGYGNPGDALDAQRLILICDKYYVYVEPDLVALAKMGFRH